MKPDPPTYTVPAGTDIGHVHLKVSDIEKSLAFYCGVLGFELTTRFGAQAAFLSAGGYPHHIGLNTWESRGGSPPPPGRPRRWAAPASTTPPSAIPPGKTSRAPSGGSWRRESSSRGPRTTG